MSNNVAVEFTVGQTNNIEAEYTVEQSQAVETEFTINASPTKVSQLENDLEYQTRQDLETALEGKQDVLTAGTGITIENNVISSTATSAEWGLITGDIDDQTDLKDALDGKQDVISDLDEIRAGASAGATAVQPADLATVATSGSYNDLLNKPTIPAAQVNSDWNANSGVAQILNKPTIPTDTADLTNGAGYITSSALSGYQTTANLVTSVSSSSTDSQYPSAKLFYDTCGDIETLINAL